MFKHKSFRIGSVLVARVLLLVIVSPVSASHLITFTSPAIASCDLGGMSISGTNIVVVRNTDVNHYLDGSLFITFVNGTFSGPGTWGSGAFTASGYPYKFKAVMRPQGSDEKYVL